MFNNGFFSTFYYAYYSCRDVLITPDDVWLAIMMYFGKYTRKNFDSFKHNILRHKGKNTANI